MQFESCTVTKQVNADRTHAIRRCIVCGSDDATTQFRFTMDFLTRARGIAHADLRAKGWEDGTSSSIVRCRRCGCNYIRDVFIADEHGERHERAVSGAAIAQSYARHAKQFTFQNANHLEFCRRVVARLLRHLAAKRPMTAEIALLDFGCSLSILSSMAKVLGFDRVVSYDLKFRPHEIAQFNATESAHPLGVRFSNELSDVERAGPYDAIVCQSAIEHFYDPRAELEHMYRLLRDDGILYIDSPIMPLDDERVLLERETEVRDPRIRKTLQKSYHIDHLNYLLPRHFAHLLQETGFVARPALFYTPVIRGRARENVVRFGKAGAQYALDCIGARFRKVYYFATKR